MKVILTKDVAGLGKAGQVKEVSDGHARNFLIPRKLAVAATDKAVDKIEKENREQAEKRRRAEEKFLALEAKLRAQTLSIKAKANKTKLFAAVHEDEIAKALAEKNGLTFEPSQINITEPIKTTGMHKVEIRLTPSHKTTININVEAI
ncbi:MAG: 50S ribosomal protein L9 [Candidatus Saccharibacteria bacterium]